MDDVKERLAHYRQKLKSNIEAAEEYDAERSAQSYRGALQIFRETFYPYFDDLEPPEWEGEPGFDPFVEQ